MCLCYVNKTQAAQSLFKKIIKDDVIELHYKWTDSHDKPQQAKLAFDRKLLNSSFRKFKRYKPHIALRHIEVNLAKSLPTLSERGAQISYKKFHDGIQIFVKGANPEQASRVKHAALLAKNEAESDYLKSAYYIKYQDSFGHSSVKPDHLQFANSSLLMLTPVAQYIFVHHKNLPTREIVNYLLSWLQSIPYSNLEDRRTTHGAGFSPPNRLLLENQGDCDSKSVLFSAALRTLFPRVGIAIILVPKHALVGVQLPYQQKDDYVKIDGNYFVLAEPTGPALLPLAKITPDSKKHIDAGSFTYELLNLR